MLKVIQAFHTVCIVLYIRCLGPVIGSSIATYCLYLDPTTGIKPSTTQIVRTATKWCASPQIMNRNMQITEICKYFYSFTYSYFSLCDAI